MNKQLLLIILLILQSLSVFIPTSIATEYIIDGDKVYIDDEYVYLSVEPHTITEDTDVVFELISKQFGGEIDVAFGINNTNMKVKNPRLWNGTAWNPLNKEIQVVNVVYQGYNKWYLLKNVNVNEDVLYKLKLTVDVVFNTSGKYFFGVKRSIDPISVGYYIDPWWHSDWQNFRTLTISNTYIDNDLINFTTLVTINSTIAGNCKTNGEDIRFLNLDNTTEYDYEIEFWNASGNSSVWVRIPRVESGVDTVFLMYYNNSVASDNQNPSGTWDSNHVGVWHLNESGSTYTDSTSYYNNGTGTSMNNNVSGKIASCVSINSGVTTARVTIPDDTELKITGAITLSAWIVQGGGSSNLFIISKHPDKEYELYHSDDSNNRWRWYRGGNVKQDNFGWVAQKNVWYYVTVADDGSNSRVYINGAQIGTTDTALVGVSSTNDVNLLNRPGSSLSIESSIDEGRISNVARNDSWIKANYNSMHTSAFITWGAEQLNVDNPTTNFTASTLSYIEINLTWTTGLNSTHTYIMRKVGSPPSSRTDGTNIYNGTGETYSDSSLNEWTAYYYSAWGFNSTTGNWTSPVGATNHTGPLNPTGVTAITRTGYLNITWTMGTRADNTLLVHNATSYPTSVTDGTLLYNGTNTYYNDTVYYSGRYTLFSWNSSTDLYSSGYQVQYGSLTINVYDENTSVAIANWDVFITNEAGTQTYENTGNNNYLVIDLGDLPTGADTAIKINATYYDFRLYYMDIYANNQYTLDAYISPENISELYVLIVVDEYDEPVDGAKIQIQQYINATSGYKNVSLRLTDANGQVAVYLIPGSWNSLYKIIITKTGYDTEIADYVPDSVYYGIYYPKIFEIHSSTDDVDLYTFWDLINFNATMYTNNTIKVMYEDTNTNTTDAQFYTYETFNFSSVLNATNTTTSDTFTFWVRGVNTSREHEIILHLNHTVLGYEIQTIIVFPVYTPKYSNVETKIRAVLGDFELNFSHLLLVYLPAIILLVIFSKKRPEIGCVGSGLWMGFVGIYLAIPTEAAALAPFIVAIGIILVIAKGGKEKL